MTMKRLLVIEFAVFICLFRCGLCLSDVRLPSVFGDNMVIQQGRPFVIWGWADPQERVSISLLSQKKVAVAGVDGKWKTRLEPIEAQGCFEMTITGSNTIIIKNILAGEVWLASGQSNMHWPLAEAINGKKEVADSDYPQIRLFHVPPVAADEPLSDCDAEWVVCRPETSGGFSAVAYFFGRYLHKELKCPVGLIAAPYGGTFIEAWMSQESLEGTIDYPAIMNRYNKDLEKYNEYVQKYEKEKKEWKSKSHAALQANQQVEPEPQLAIEATWIPRNYPGRLFNAMIHPIIPYELKGVIWYQGESNALADRSAQYERLFETMLNDWRRRWGYDFPFYYVQLASFANNPWQPDDADNADWAEFRDIQLKLTRLKNCEMMVTVDLGDSYDIHPKNKQDVGRRLGNAALAKVYGKNMEYSGPVYDSMKQVGERVRLSFEHTGEGLIAKGDILQEFKIAGDDGIFVKANAEIVSNNEIEVWSEKVNKPVAVRYGWRRCPNKCNLYNSEALPASPFRTDSYPLVSADNK
jgi:sialate O-acetylesterase